MESHILAVGNLVYVTCYGPYRGFRGIIRAIDAIAFTDTQEEPFCFYLVALLEGQMKEPLWLVHDDIEEVKGANTSLWRPSKMELSRVEIEALEIVANAVETEQNWSREAVLTS